MSIGAIINNVFFEEYDLVLVLMSKDVDGHRGQPRLRIKNYTYVPIPGQEIWGGADRIIIETNKGQRYYHRIGYTELVED